MPDRLVPAGLLALALCGLASGMGPAGVDLDAAGRARMAAWGPWPPPPPPASSPAQAAAVLLGEELFHSARLSGDGRVRCAGCHEPWRHFTDARPRALGTREGTRNTPTLLDVARRRVFGWEGATVSLETQCLRPLREPGEMLASPAHVAGLLRGDARWRADYAAAFGEPAPADDEGVLENAGRALAAYVATLQSPATAFDAWREALAAGPAPVSSGSSGSSGSSVSPALTPAALRGLRLFIGRGGCADCHAGAGFTDDLLHPSRIGGAPRPAGGPTGLAIRTPSLRGVAVTAPYMHDGSVPDLCEAVRPHASATGTEPGPEPALSARERSDLVAFLRTLGPSTAPPPADCAAPP